MSKHEVADKPIKNLIINPTKIGKWMIVAISKNQVIGNNGQPLGGEEVRCRLVRHTRCRIVTREDRRIRIRGAFQRPGDTRVELLTPAYEKAFVCCVLDQCVLENVCDSIAAKRRQNDAGSHSD